MMTCLACRAVLMRGGRFFYKLRDPSACLTQFVNSVFMALVMGSI